MAIPLHLGSDEFGGMNTYRTNLKQSVDRMNVPLGISLGRCNLAMVAIDVPSMLIHLFRKSHNRLRSPQSFTLVEIDFWIAQFRNVVIARIRHQPPSNLGLPPDPTINLVFGDVDATGSPLYPYQSIECAAFQYDHYYQRFHQSFQGPADHNITVHRATLQDDLGSATVKACRLVSLHNDNGLPDVPTAAVMSLHWTPFIFGRPFIQPPNPTRHNIHWLYHWYGPDGPESGSQSLLNNMTLDQRCMSLLGAGWRGLQIPKTPNYGWSSVRNSVLNNIHVTALQNQGAAITFRMILEAMGINNIAELNRRVDLFTRLIAAI